MEKIDFIIDLDLPVSFSEANPLIGALIDCLDPEEKIELLRKTFIDNLNLRNIALRKICEDIDGGFQECHVQLIRDLKNNISDSAYKQKSSSGFCLSRICIHVPDKEKFDIEKFLINSKYIGMRRRGYKRIDEHFSEIHVQLLKEAWEHYSDSECAHLIIKHFPHEYIVENRNQLIDVLSEYWQISRLFLKIGDKYPELIRELKEIDSISYCYLLSKFKMSLPKEEAAGYLKESIHDERFGLLIWSIGKLHLWDLLVELVNDLSLIESRRNQKMKTKYGI